MARNSEKQYGRLNRLLLSKERDEYEKNNPKRPNLSYLETPEEIQKWIPSIKKDIEFYLLKSQVTCYSDAHIEECKQKVLHLEKEFKAFVQKLKQLSPGTLDAIPWTNRPYKRKLSDPNPPTPAMKEFVPIHTPILNKYLNSKPEMNTPITNLALLDEPLVFSSSEKLSWTDSENGTIMSQKVEENRSSQNPCPGNIKTINENYDNFLCSEKRVSLVTYTCSSDSES